MSSENEIKYSEMILSLEPDTGTKSLLSAHPMEELMAKSSYMEECGGITYPIMFHSLLNVGSSLLASMRPPTEPLAGNVALSHTIHMFSCTSYHPTICFFHNYIFRLRMF